MFRITRKKVAALAVTGALVAGGAVAYAYWTNSGSGTGTASTGHVTAGSIVVTDDNGATNLGPGFAAHSVNLSFQNVDPYDEYVTSVTITLSDATGGSCATNNWAINAAQYSTPVTITINKQVNVGQTVTVPGAYSIGMFETGANQNGCETKTPAVNIAYASS